jgi:HK97 family phage major capsid protein
MSQQAQAEGLHREGLQDWEEIQTRVDELRRQNEAGELSAEALAAEVATLNDKADAIEARFDAAAALNTISDRGRTLAARVTQPAWSRPLTDTDTDDLSATPESDDDPKLVRQLLNRYLRPADLGGGRAALSKAGWDFLTRPRKRAGNEMLAAERGESLALTPYVDPSGGYVQAEQLSTEIIKIRDRATTLPARVNTKTIVGVRLTIPTVKIDVTFTKGSKATGASITPVDLSEIFGRTSLTVHPKRALLKVPEEFFEDPEFDALGAIAMEAERSSREDDETDILTGSGASEPLGIIDGLQKLYDAGATQVARTPAAGTSAVTADEIETFDTYLHAGALMNAVYVGPRAFVRAVRLFRTEEGGAGTGDRMFKRSNIAGGLPQLLDKEVITSEFFPDTITSGSEGDVMWCLIDLADYWWVVQKDIQLRVLNERFADENMVGYKWTKARDGSLVRGDAALYMRRGA